MLSLYINDEKDFCNCKYWQQRVTELKQKEITVNSGTSSWKQNNKMTPKELWKFQLSLSDENVTQHWKKEHLIETTHLQHYIKIKILYYHSLLEDVEFQ